MDSEAFVDDEDSTSDTLREDQENIFGDDQPNIRYKMRCAFLQSIVEMFQYIQYVINNRPWKAMPFLIII